MFKKMQMVFLIAALAAVMVFNGALNSEAGVGKMLDIGEAPWAQQEITEMSSLEILQGYPDGKFFPYQSVTRLEAVAMLIRMLGLDEQARAMEKAEVDYQVPSNLPWGRGYLIMAVERGMLDKNHLNQLEPTGVATRAQVAALVCLALQLETPEPSLNFADAAQIPPGYQGYVAALVAKKLMQGLPGNVFEPNNVINRAQMAVLLSNLLNKDFANPYPDRHISGTISNIEPISGLIALQGGAIKFLTAECQCFLDGKKVDAADIKSGDAVKLALDDNGQVVFVRAMRGNSSSTANNTGTTYKGKVHSLLQISGEYWLGITSFDGTQLTRQVTDSVKVHTQEGNKEVSILSKGDYVEIKIVGNKIIEINSLETSTLNGTVAAVSSSELTVRSDEDTDNDLDVSGDVTVVKNNSTKVFADIKKGDRVKVTVLDNKALRIDILSSPNLEGVIREITTSGINLITIGSDDGDVRDYVVQSDVEVTQNGSRTRFEDLREGDQVKLELNNINRVVYIELVEANSDKLTGKITKLDTSGTWGITIRDGDGYALDYVVTSSVEVKRNGSYIDFEDLNVGEYVKLELNIRDQVDYIETVGTNVTTFTGSIADLGTGSNLWIIINKSDGTTKRYSISDSYTFYRNSESLRLRDIVIGSEVKVQVAGGKVTSIYVTNDTNITLTGEVAYVYTGSKKILIKQLSDNEFSYYLADNAILKDKIGRNISLDDISEGWEVELVLRNGKIYKLTRQE